MNGGQSGTRDQMVNADELYMADLMEWGEREFIITTSANLNLYASEYAIIIDIKIGDISMAINDYLKTKHNENEKIAITVVRGSSKWTTKQMSIWIDRIFNRLAINGVQVTNPGELQNYWHNWRNFLNDNKINMHDYKMTKKEYKELNPLCEACGKSIIDGSGELAHISAVGMGRNRDNEPDKDYPNNWLHLCATPCHREVWHNQGVEKFISIYPHLAYKINTALKKNKLIPATICKSCGFEITEDTCPCGGLGFF
jgi:hypothetical protein